MRVTKFKSIVGWTYVLSDGYCVLGYYRSFMTAKAALADTLKRRAARYPQTSGAADPAGE
jgi:hypothetical protein